MMNTNKKITTLRNAPVTLRITALWAFSEAFLGGILHGLKVPFAGLFLALIASICMTIIAASTTKKGEVLKATMLVLAVKFLLSPHTPYPAYIAVFIQGAVGELLFLNRKTFFKPAAFILSLFALTYSAFQHLLMLTILFGNAWWKAVDIFLNKITQSFIKENYQYSLYIIIIYFGCYFIAGIAGGILNCKLVDKIKKGTDPEFKLFLEQYESLKGFDHPRKRTSKIKKLLPVLIGLLAVILLIVSYLPFFSNSFSKNSIAELILRAIIILIVWNLFITPLLQKAIKSWFEKYQQKNNSSIQQVVALLPDIRLILQASWKFSYHNNKLIRVKNFITTSVVQIASYE